MIYRFWDMDHTIVNNDCDVSWKRFLMNRGIAGPEQQALVDEFFRQYEQGILKVDEYLTFQLREFAGRTEVEVRDLCKRHFVEMVQGTFYPGALRTIERQRREGETVILLTATNREIARPVAAHLELDDVIASELEFVDGRFTGKPTDVYCCGEGKAIRLKSYCRENGIDVAEVHYYGDSISDRFVLEAVGHPHVVNPMPALRELAHDRGWDLIEFKDDE